jgi:hypothetical protein
VDVDVSIYDAKYGESARSRQHLQGATLFLIKPGEKKRKEKKSAPWNDQSTEINWQRLLYTWRPTVGGTVTTSNTHSPGGVKAC